MAMIDDLISRVGNLNDLKLLAYMDADGMFYGGTPAAVSYTHLTLPTNREV